MGQALDVLREPLGVEALDGLDGPGVERAPAVLEEAPVGHLVGQRVLEGVLDVGEQARLVEELGRLEPGEALGQRVRGSPATPASTAIGTSVPTTEAVWSSALSSGGSRSMRAARIACTVAGTWTVSGVFTSRYAPRSPDEHPVVHEAPHALLEEERVALGPREEEPFQGLEAGVAPEQGLQQRGRILRRERVQPELAVVGLPAPAVPVLRAVVDEEQEPGRRQALDQPIEHGLRLGVDPVEVLEHDQERLDLALPQEEPLQGVDGALPPLRAGPEPPTGGPPPARRAARGTPAAPARGRGRA